MQDGVEWDALLIDFHFALELQFRPFRQTQGTGCRISAKNPGKDWLNEGMIVGHLSGNMENFIIHLERGQRFDRSEGPADNDRQPTDKPLRGAKSGQNFTPVVSPNQCTPMRVALLSYSPARRSLVPTRCVFGRLH